MVGKLGLKRISLLYIAREGPDLANVGQPGEKLAGRPYAGEPTSTLVDQVTNGHCGLFARNGVYPSKLESKLDGLGGILINGVQLICALGKGCRPFFC